MFSIERQSGEAEEGGLDACSSLSVKQFMKGVIGNVIPMLKHNKIGLRTHQSCNQDVNKMFS